MLKIDSKKMAFKMVKWSVIILLISIVAWLALARLVITY